MSSAYHERAVIMFEHSVPILGLAFITRQLSSHQASSARELMLKQSISSCFARHEPFSEIGRRLANFLCRGCNVGRKIYDPSRKRVCYVCVRLILPIGGSWEHL